MQYQPRLVSPTRPLKRFGFSHYI